MCGGRIALDQVGMAHDLDLVVDAGKRQRQREIDRHGDDRTSTSRSASGTLALTLSDTVRWDVVEHERPAASVVDLGLNPVTGLLMFTVTATMTPPVESFTVPCTVPAPPSPCARAVVATPVRKPPTIVIHTDRTTRCHTRPMLMTASFRTGKNAPISERRH